MLPALAQCDGMRVQAFASRTLTRARDFSGRFGGDAMEGYGRLLDRDDVDAVYMPLPTGLHREWAPRVLEAGKHLLVEKSLACDLEGAQMTAEAARRAGCLVMENFHFPFHRQHRWVIDTLASGAVGNVHLLRATFGFPPLPPGNFRYDAAMGGGALLDAGAYTVKTARLFLGNDLTLIGAILHEDRNRRVDVYGEAQLLSPSGAVAQVAFGFDYHYQCQYELLGTKGKLSVLRAYTAPPDVSPVVRIERQGVAQDESIAPDNAHRNLWMHFRDRILSGGDFRSDRDEVLAQARLLDEIRTRAIRR
jgi:predicted dehydrogenase